MCRILIGGDISPQNRTLSELLIGQNSLSGISSFVKEADFSIVNLESPVKCEGALPITKRGPNLNTPVSFLDSIKNVGINMVTLANNHFMDYGDKSALHTINECHERGLLTVGAGNTITEASSIAYIKVNDLKIAVINCCEHEYSIATPNHAGSNPLDPILISYDIKKSRESSDFVIVIVHGGVENYQLPTPRMKKTYRFFVDCGADAVINHHQHCFSGYEFYNNKPILYGLGNLCFDWKNQKTTWYEGLMALLSFDKVNTNVSLEIKFYKQAIESGGPRLCTLDEEQDMKERLNSLNAIITDDKQLEDEYNSFMDDTDKNYDYIISPWSISYTLRLFQKGLLPNYFRKRKWLWLQNALTCESHYERFLHMVNNKLK